MMKQYIAERMDTIFPKEIAWNLREMTGIPVSPESVRKYIQRLRN
jgi:hypothetical protein